MNSLYGEIIELTKDGRPITPELVLSSRSGSKQGIIENVQSFTSSKSLINAAEISFNVYKYANSIRCSLWDDLRNFKLIYIPHLDSTQFNPWYELRVEIDDDDATIKHCRGIHIQEAELSQLTLNNIEINTEIDIERKDYSPTIIYNPDKPESSLLHRLLKDKGSHYKISHVDSTIASLQRTFSWNGATIKDAFDDIATEVECLFRYGESMDNDGKIHRTISVYDLNDYCADCGNRGTFLSKVCPKCNSKNVKSGYGEDSGIFLNKENFASEINYTSNSDDVKNCFRLVAGDDLMTATAMNINPNGSQYIWHFTDETKNDMSVALREKLNAYDTEYQNYATKKQIDIPKSSVDDFNTLIAKYKSYDNKLVPASYPIVGYAHLTDLYYSALNLYSILKTTLAPASSIGVKTTAAKEILKLTSNTLSPIGVQNANIASHTTIASAVQNYAKVFIDTSLYRVTVTPGTYSSGTWNGQITLTAYADKNDTATTPQLSIKVSDASPDFIKCQLEKAMKKNEVDASGTVELFKKNDADFKNALSFYSIDNLNILANITRGCLDVLIQQGIADPSDPLYTSVYLPYFNKNTYIQDELRERESEVLKIRGHKERPIGLLDFIEVQRQYISSKLDLRVFLGETLWGEFCSFRRDDEYQNSNFISDGLSNEELIRQAQEFVDTANRELIKAATLQHSISCNLSNILLVAEQEASSIKTVKNLNILSNDTSYLVKESDALSPILEKFSVGNWIRVEVDDRIYKLRLTDYTIDYETLESLSVEFSDVTYASNYMSDVKDVLSKAQSMATTYSSVKHQANKGHNADIKITDMVKNGLDLTNKKIVSDAKSQDFILDETGMTMRKKDEYGDAYSPEQTKFINHGFYYTTDNWKTVSTGLGRFKYYDPKTGSYNDGYGLIANHIVGNIILGNEVGIYNTSGSLQFDQNGFTVTAGTNEINKNLFTLQKKNADGSLTKYIYVDDNGEIKINGKNIVMTATDDLASYVDKNIQNLENSTVSSYIEEFYKSSSPTQLFGGAWATTQPVWENGKYIWRRTKITKGNGETSYSPSLNGLCITGNTGSVGKEGVGVKDVVNYYLASASSSGITHSTQGWTTAPQLVSSSKKYLWNYEKTIYTNENTKSTAPCVIGTYGDDGSTGNGIERIEEHFQVSSSNTIVPTTWSPTPPLLSETNKYLWNYETTYYTNNTTVDSKKRVIGVYGDKGLNGTGVQSSDATYQTSDDGVNVPTGEWTTTIPKTTSSKPYLWTRVITTYTDNTTSTAYSVGSTIEGVSVGAKNILLNSSVLHTVDTPLVATYHMTETMVVNEQYTCTIWGSLGTGKEKFAIYLDADTNHLGDLLDNGDGTYSITFTGKTNTPTPLTTTTTPIINQTILVYALPSTTTIASTITKIKLERGNKSTDWTPAPEEFVDSGYLNDILNGKDGIYEQLGTSKSQITQLTNSISSLVVDGNGSSLMTQKGDSWVFNIGGINQTLNNAIDIAQKNQNGLATTDKYVDELKKQSKALQEKTAIIEITTYNSQPAIILGQKDSAFKLRITNTSIDFLDGTEKVAYITNQSLYITRAIIKDEIQIGDGTGWIWKRRDNGNLGLRYI